MKKRRAGYVGIVGPKFACLDSRRNYQDKKVRKEETPMAVHSCCPMGTNVSTLTTTKESMNDRKRKMKKRDGELGMRCTISERDHNINN